MASTLNYLVLLVASLAILKTTVSGDPDILKDFETPLFGTIDANYFTYTGMRHIITTLLPPAVFNATKASMKEFPALEGQSVSYSVLQFPNGTVNPPHTHPRSAELLFLFYGCLEVGFVDTEGTLYSQSLRSGDMFVFPKGLLHFQYNPDKVNAAFAVSAFGSASAGTVSLPMTIFGTGIDDIVLAKAFKTDVKTIKRIKGGFVPKTF